MTRPEGDRRMKIINDKRHSSHRVQPRGQTSRGRWSIPVGVLSAMVIAVLLAGCGSEQSAKNPGNAAKGDAKSNTPNGGKASAGEMTEDQAREKLKTALDCWVFGDDDAKLKQDHPEITFLDTDWAYGRGSKLLKYDLGTGRKYQTGYEFAVGLSFQSKAGTEIKETRPFWVTKNAKGEWTIMKTPR
jgi:hypothetical protein